MKTCPICKKDLPLTEFYSLRGHGPYCYCIKCSREKARIYRENNREKHLDAVKRWSEKNRERVLLNMKKWHARNKEKERVRIKQYEKDNRIERNEYRKRRKVIERYGISYERYEEMFREQNGMCAICGRFSTDGKRFHIDHDHKTGFVRGLLCMKCNMALGCLNDDTDLFMKACEYLKKERVV